MYRPTNKNARSHVPIPRRCTIHVPQIACGISITVPAALWPCHRGRDSSTHDKGRFRHPCKHSHSVHQQTWRPSFMLLQAPSRSPPPVQQTHHSTVKRVNILVIRVQFLIKRVEMMTFISHMSQLSQSQKSCKMFWLAVANVPWNICVTS
jgi:hypothetical protein